MRERMRDNEALLHLYLTHQEESTAILPGGFLIAARAPYAGDVAVEKLPVNSPYEQLVLPGGDRKIA